MYAKLQKPEALSTFGRSDWIHYIYLYIKALTLAFSGQLIPVWGGQGQWLLH
jgi:hypothetical protein